MGGVGSDLLMLGEEEEGGALKMQRQIWSRVCWHLSVRGLIEWGCRVHPQALFYLWVLSPGRCQAGRLWEWVAEGLLRAPVVQTSLQECYLLH